MVAKKDAVENTITIRSKRLCSANGHTEHRPNLNRVYTIFLELR